MTQKLFWSYSYFYSELLTDFKVEYGSNEWGRPSDVDEMHLGMGFNF